MKTVDAERSLSKLANARGVAGKHTTVTLTLIDKKRLHELAIIANLLTTFAAQFIALCSSAKPCAIGENLRSVPDPISRLQERLIYVGARIHLPTPHTPTMFSPTSFTT